MCRAGEPKLGLEKMIWSSTRLSGPGNANFNCDQESQGDADWTLSSPKRKRACSFFPRVGGIKFIPISLQQVLQTSLRRRYWEALDHR